MRKSDLQFKLPVSFFKEGKSIVAYCSILDLATCGDDLADAQRMFDEVVRIFFDELIRKGTLEEVLLDLGWQKKNHQFLPPLELLHTMTSVNIPLLR